MKITVERKSIGTGILICGLFAAENLEDINEEFRSLGLNQRKELNDFYKIIKKDKRINKAKLNYYFKNYDIYNATMSLNINCIVDVNYKEEDFEEFIEKLCNKSKEDILKDIIFSITEAKFRSGKKAREYIDSLEFIDEEVVMAHINEIKGFYEYKWKLAELISKGEKIYKEFAEFVIECMNILKPYMGELITIGEQWADYLEKQIEERGIEFINSLIKVSYDGIEAFTIYPKVIECYNYGFYLSQDTKQVNIELGYRVFDLINSFKGKDEEEWFFKVLKCLADESRYEILRLLSKKEMYGGELAAAMKLSVGTISYHTTNLMLIGLIKEKRVNNRTYYQADKEKLLKWSRIFAQRFNNKAEI